MMMLTAHFWCTRGKKHACDVGWEIQKTTSQPRTHMQELSEARFVCAQNIYSFIDDSFIHSPCSTKIKHESSGADLALKYI